jgi:microcompartment protein CcmL/EutN
MAFNQRHDETVQIGGPAVGLVETSSIARGLLVADQMVKKAPVELLVARPISPGKHLVLVAGEVADVGEAMSVGIATAAATLVDRLELPQAHQALLDALAGKLAPLATDGAIAIVETWAVASAILAADAALKAAEVRLPVLRLGDGLGGKGYFLIGGEQSDVQAALAAAVAAVPAGLLASTELIARLHGDVVHLLRR